MLLIPQGQQMDANNVPMYLASASMIEHSLNGGGGGGDGGGGGGGSVLAYNSLMHQSNTTPTVNDNPRTLYVGNLDPSITEDFIHTLFSPFGRITGLKLMNDNLSDSYCFIEYDDHSSAATAILTMNKRLCLDREIKVNWASNSGSTSQKPDTSRHYHIFVGDLSPEIETKQLCEAFSVFGDISDCRVVRDPHTLKSKGYGFVSFIKKQDAENAIANMNGQWLGHRPIRTNWATRKIPTLRNDNNVSIGPSAGNRPLNYEEVFNQSSITNYTVYCGGIINGLTEELIQKIFCRFGTIQETRVFKDKGYAFIKFTCKAAATNAIVLMHNQEILGQTVKCSWGKETIDSNMPTVAPSLAQGLAASTPLIYPYSQQLSYWYQPFNAGLQPPNQPQYTTVQAAAGMQYPYNQYFPHGAASATGAVSTSQSNAFNSSSMGIPISAAWTHHQGQHHATLSNNSNSIVTSHMSVPIHHQPSAAMQQPTVINAYSMQGYQAQ